MAVKLIPMEAKAPRDGVAFRSLIPKPEDIGHAGWLTIIAPIEWTRLILRTPSHLASVLFGAKYFHITIPSFKSVTGWPSCLSDFSFASFTKILQYRSASSCDRPTKTFPKAPTTISYFIRQCL
jgi:hypothetical protein